MKQHITIKQLNELSKEQRKSFNKWVGCPEGLTGFDLQTARIITIGQMIEFLMDYEYFEENSDLVGEPLHTVRNLNWEYDEELCDFLWEEVKELL